jgi:hypothetical protein
VVHGENLHGSVTFAESPPAADEQAGLKGEASGPAAPGILGSQGFVQLILDQGSFDATFFLQAGVLLAGQSPDFLREFHADSRARAAPEPAANLGISGGFGMP